jgi:dimethylhistidine N-methyltransferase
VNHGSPPPTLRAPAILDLRGDDATDGLTRLRADLAGEPPCIEPKFFYDPLGASLFEAITRLPEYYLTRTEDAIAAEYSPAIAAHIRETTPSRARQTTLIDLGAGSCEKASRWITELQAQRYVAVDIALAGLPAALDRLQQQHPDVDLVGVGCDFSRQLRLPTLPGAAIVLYPGSSIGNFSPAQARHFLGEVHAACAGGGLLIGVDLIKPAAVLEAAYDDALGVTAAFNRNVLLHVNRLLGADFRLQDWSHAAFYNPAEQRVEMHLEARRTVSVTWPGGGRRFAKGMRIHTENSYKWDPDAFGQLLAASGFGHQRRWSDPQEQFAVFWAAG